MANGLDFASDTTRIARDGLDGAVIEDERPLAYRTTGEELSSLDDSVPDELLIEHEEQTYVVGSEAKRVASAFDDQPDPLFVDGVLVDEPFAEPAIDALLGVLLANGMGNRLCYTTPGTIVDVDRPTDHHRAVIDESIGALGYDATPVSTGFAIVADQFRDENLTGLGIYIGSDVTSVALVYYGVPVIVFSIAKGRDWIVERAAGETGHANEQVASRLETFSLDPDGVADDIESALAQSYDELTGSLVEAIRIELEAADLDRGVSVPVAVAGPWAVEGVEFLLGGRFDAAQLPFSVRGIRRAADPEESAVRGALAAAQDDVDEFDSVTWSAHQATDGETASAEPGSSEAMTTQLTFDDSASTADAIADDAIEQLFDRLGTRDDELGSLGDRVDSVANDLEALQTEAASNEDLTSLESAVDAVRSSLSDASSTIDSIESELAAREVATDELSDALESAEGTLADRLEALESDLETVEQSHDSDIERLDDAVTATESALESAVDELETAIADGDEALASTVESSIDAVRSDLEPSIESLHETQERLDVELESLRDERSNDLSSFEETVDEIDSQLRADVEGIESVVESLESTVDSLESTLEAHGDRLPTLESELRAVESAVESLDDDLDEHQGTVADLDETVTSLDSDVESLESTVSAIEPTLAELETSVEALETVDEKSVSEVDSTLETLTTSVESVESALESVDERVDDTQAWIESDVAELRESVESIRTELDELETTDDGGEPSPSIPPEYDDRLDDIEAAIDAIDRSGDVSELDDGTSLPDAVTDLRESYDAFERTHDVITDRLDALETSESERAEPLSIEDVVAAEAVASTDSVESSLTDVESSLKSEIASVRSVVDELNAAVETLQHSAANEEASTTEGVSHQELESVTSSISTLESRLDDIEATGWSDERADRLDSIESTLERHDDERAQLELRIERLSSSDGESLSDEPLERIAELDQRMHELSRKTGDLLAQEATNTESADEHARPANGQSSLGSMAMGAGAASVIAGGALAADELNSTVGTTELGVGAVILGAVIVAVAIFVR
ncbi:hypothetical protein [Halovivax gelatinilyticus]|uniref:hypothetical protein n=1 Tax=Halovivax gelatinilyticus TaxID=2961597 RepID=UPI0020CA33DD|nr:hypothetical protein [Halovivax gelatinilyticus]